MSIAFIVDGVSEKKIIQRLCGDATVRITQLNGRDVTLSAIVDKVESFIRLFKDRFSPVYVVVDRESRDIESEDMEQQLREMLAAKNIDVGGIVFCCPDRMIENWIIAGTVQMDGEDFIIEHENDNADGFGGKSRLKEALKSKKISYGETSTGVDMFCRMDFEQAARRSASCGRFLRAIKSHCPKFSDKDFSIGN